MKEARSNPPSKLAAPAFVQDRNCTGPQLPRVEVTHQCVPSLPADPLLTRGEPRWLPDNELPRHEPTNNGLIAYILCNPHLAIRVKSHLRESSHLPELPRPISLDHGNIDSAALH